MSVILTCETCQSCNGPRMGTICKDGFIQQGVYPEPPPCLWDELPEHWIDEKGGPKFYSPTPQERSE